MKTENKVWGQTTELFNNNTASVHYLAIRRKGYCSEHKHAQKENIFYVVSGELLLTLWKERDDMEGKEVYLMAGDSCIIPIKTWHMFRAITAVECIEIYDYKYDGVDIIRRTVGGLGGA